MERYGTHCEQTYRTNFNRSRAKCINWLKFNLALSRRYLNIDGLLAIAIDPSYISKSGKKTPHIGTFWSGCASSMKHGLEIMGLALVVHWSYALSGKAQEPVGLFLQRIIRITEYCKGYDEGKRSTIFHGFFQGTHGKHIHRKINFRQVP